MSGKSLEELLQELKAPDHRKRQAAVEALARLRNVRATELLCYALQYDPNWLVRYRAASFLGILRDADALSILVDALWYEEKKSFEKR